MKTARVSWLVLGLCGMGIVHVEDPHENLGDLNPDTAKRGSEEVQHQLVGNYGQMPLSFEANQGQADDPVHFLSRGSGYTLFLTADEAVLSLRQLAAEEPDSTASDVLRMQLIGACPNPQAMGTDMLPGQSNYLIGDDPAQWHLNIPHYAKVHYQDIYPGIDLVYYGNQRQLEYDFIMAPGTSSENIQVRFAGAERLSLDEGGQLVLHLTKGQVVLRTPIAYQEVGGTRRAIECEYALLGEHQVGFSVGPYDTGEPLVIDPTLSYSTYLGSSGLDIGRGIAVDDSGNAYITGAAGPPDFPRINPSQVGYGGGESDAFVVKLNASGSAVYSTYLGGSGFDIGWGIAIDSSGNAYVVGRTQSTNFPTMNPLQATHSGGESDAFVVKLNASGSSFIYSTYLGGSGYDEGYGIAVDGSGNACVTGNLGNSGRELGKTYSTNFPTVNPLQPAYGGGGSDAFVAKLNASGLNLIYATYLGGTGTESAWDIAVDSSGNAYVTGTTTSTNFPTVNPFQAVFGGHILGDAFVAKLNAFGSTLIYSTYLGGTGSEGGSGIAVDGSGNAYITGSTSSENFPTVNPLQMPHFVDGRVNDAFVTKLNASGSAIYSTYLGGNSRDFGYGIAVDGSGNAYIIGGTSSTDFPLVDPLQPAYGGGELDAFVVKLKASGSGLAFATYLGGTDRDVGNGIAVDGSGNIYVTGETSSRDFPTLHPLQAVHAGGDTSAPFASGLRDAFVTKIAPPPAPAIAVSPSPLSFGSVMVGQSKALPLTVSNTGTDTLFISSASISGADASQFSASPSRLTVPAGGSGSVVVTFTPTPGEAKSALLTLSHNAAPTVTATAVTLSGTGDTPPANPFQPYTADPYTMALVHFDEGRGTTIADQSGNRNTGRFNSGTRWTKTGRFSSAVNFTGSNFISMRSSASLNATAALTVEAWIYPRQHPTQWNAGIVAKWGTRGKGDDSYELALTPSGQVGFRTSDGTEAGTSSILSSATIPLNTWTHVAGTFTKGGAIKIYVNGSLDKGVPAKNVDIQTTTQEVWVGQAEQGPLRNIRFNGYIDEVRISNVARNYIPSTARPSGNALDVNGDGIVSVGDAILILEIIAGEKPDTDAADANGDGKIDVQDALLVLRNLPSAKPAAVYSFFRAHLESDTLEEKVVVLEGFSQMALGRLVFEYDPEIIDDLQLRTAGDAFLISPQDEGEGRVIVNLLRIHKEETPDDRLFLTVKSRSAGGVVQLAEASLVDWKAQSHTMSQPIAVEFQTSPCVYALFANYPNPFNPETVIRYQLPEQVKVKLEIYDLLGQRVRLLAEQMQPAGMHQAVWNGRDEQDVPVSSGIYFCRLQAGSFTAVRRLALVK